MLLSRISARLSSSSTILAHCRNSLALYARRQEPQQQQKPQQLIHLLSQFRSLHQSHNKLVADQVSLLNHSNLSPYSFQRFGISSSAPRVSHGDIISFQENDVRSHGEEIRRYFYIKVLVEKVIGKFRDHPVRMWRRTKTEWLRLLKTKRGCRLLLKSRFLQQLHSSVQEEELERTKKFGSEKVCLASSFAEHNRMKRNLYHFKSLSLSKRRNEKNRNLPTRTRSPIAYSSSLYSNSTYCSTSPHQFTTKRKNKRISLPTHYMEVNYKTLKAVVFYGPNINHIPLYVRSKDLNLLLHSAKGRGQNI